MGESETRPRFVCSTIPEFVEAYNDGFVGSSVTRWTTPFQVTESQHPGVITREDLSRFQAFMFLRLIAPENNPQLNNGNDTTVNQGDVTDFIDLAGRAGELTEIEAAKFTELALGFGLFDQNFDLEDLQLLLEIASVAITGGAFIVGARSVRIAQAMYRSAAALDASVILIDVSQGEFGDAAFAGALLVVDLRGLGSLGDEAAATVKTSLAPLEATARVARGFDDVADVVADLRAVGLFEAADDLALRPAGVVASASGDAAFVAVRGRQRAIDSLVDGGGAATVPAAEKLVDDYIALLREQVDDVAEFDRLSALFKTDPRAASAWGRWGDEIFDAGGGLKDDLLAAVCSANSFSGDTLVALADGTLLPIADVQVGDQVLAYDFDTGETVGREVTATLPHTDWLIEAHFSDGSIMSVTEDHRFWSITDDSWVELQHLDTTDVLLTPDGVTVTVDWLDWDAGVTAPAWDLTVAEEHNFFVAATGSAEPLLVHNNTPAVFCGLPLRARHSSLSGADDILSETSRSELVEALRELGETSPGLLDDALDALAGGGDPVAARVLVERAGQFPDQFVAAAKRGWAADYTSREFLWSQEPITFTGEVTRTVRFRVPGPPVDNPGDVWGVTDAHLGKHFFGSGDVSLGASGLGELRAWLDETERLLTSTPRRVESRLGPDGVSRNFETIRSESLEYKFEIVVHSREDGTYDFVTWLTKQN